MTVDLISTEHIDIVLNHQCLYLLAYYSNVATFYNRNCYVHV